MKAATCLFANVLTFMCLFLTLALAKERPISPPRLVFLNHPETVLNKGVLAEEVTTCDTTTRLFFHFRNATKHSRHFRISFSGTLLNYQEGVAVNIRPGIAGADSVAAFLKYKIVPKRVSPIVDYVVPSEQTVSGMVDATFMKGTKWKCSLGEGSLIKTAKVILSPWRETSVLADLLPEKETFLRIGDTKDHAISGDYGTSYNIDCVSKATGWQKLTLILQPRASETAFSVSVGGTIFHTEEVKVFTQKRIMTQFIAPGQHFKMIVIPTGGYSLPIEVHIKLSKI